MTDTGKSLLWRELGKLNNLIRFIRRNLLSHNLALRDGAQLQRDFGTRPELSRKISACFARQNHDLPRRRLSSDISKVCLAPFESNPQQKYSDPHLAW
jgi:hypothetical protein